MSSAIACTTEGDLYDPSLGAALAGIKEQSLLVEGEESLLDDFLCLTLVVQDPESDSEYESRIARVKQVESFGIFGLHPSHQFFVTWRRDLGRLRSRDASLPARSPNNGECQCAPIRRRAHV